MRRCMGCMRELDDAADVCPHCGYANHDASVKNKVHLRPGTVLQNRYMLGKVLGQGGFGITYIAWDRRLEKPVAVKEYFPTAFVTRMTGQREIVCIDEESQKRYASGLQKMLHESRVLAQFTDQPNIVQVLDCIEENGTAYIVMEYLRGETVQMILRREGQMTPERTMQIIIPVLRALETIHQTGLIHRDISPDNLFVCEDGNVKLLDFGAARFADGVDQKTLSVMLKKGFAPIEQYSSHGRQGPFTDVYAVCATMYRMLTGVTPESSLERMAADTLRPISEITQIPHGVEAVILQGMAVQATDRIQSAGELCDALQRAFRQAEDAYPAAEKKRAQKTPRFLTRARMKRICVVLIVLILAALIALGVVLALRAGAL